MAEVVTVHRESSALPRAEHCSQGVLKWFGRSIVIHRVSPALRRTEQCRQGDLKCFREVSCVHNLPGADEMFCSMVTHPKACDAWRQKDQGRGCFCGCSLMLSIAL